MKDCPHGHPLRRKCETCSVEDDQAEIAQLRGSLSLAEEGLANYAQENAELRRCLDGGVDCAEEKLRLRAELDAIKRTREQERDYADVCYENEKLRLRSWVLSILLYPNGAPREAVEGDI